MPTWLAQRLAERLPEPCRALCLNCGDQLSAHEAVVGAPGAPGYWLHPDCAGDRP